MIVLIRSKTLVKILEEQLSLNANLFANSSITNGILRDYPKLKECQIMYTSLQCPHIQGKKIFNHMVEKLSC